MASTSTAEAGATLPGGDMGGVGATLVGGGVDGGTSEITLGGALGLDGVAAGVVGLDPSSPKSQVVPPPGGGRFLFFLPKPNIVTLKERCGSQITLPTIAQQRLALA